MDQQRKLESKKCQISTECAHCKVYVPSENILRKSNGTEAQFNCKICNVSVQLIVKPLDLNADEKENEIVRSFQENFEFEDVKIEIKDEPIDVESEGTQTEPTETHPGAAPKPLFSRPPEANSIPEGSATQQQPQTEIMNEPIDVPSFESSEKSYKFRTRRTRLISHYAKQHNMEKTEAQKLMPRRKGGCKVLKPRCQIEEAKKSSGGLKTSGPQVLSNKSVLKNRPFGQANPFQYKCQVEGCGFRTRRTRLLSHYMKRHNMEQKEAEKLMPRRLITTAKMDRVQCPKSYYIFQKPQKAVCQSVLWSVPYARPQFQS